MSRSVIWDANRLVLYLPAAALTLADIDGSREKGITNQAEKFLNSSKATFNKRPGDFVWQIRDLGTNTRAFATWCQNHNIDCEMCVVQDVYGKKNEEEYWEDLGDYDEAGRRYCSMFEDLSQEEYDEWVSSVGSKENFRTVLSE